MVVTSVTQHSRNKYELYSQQLELGLRHVCLASETSRSEHFHISSGNIPKKTERVGKESNTDSYMAHLYSFTGAMGALTVDINNRDKRSMSLATRQQQAKKRMRMRGREKRERENSCWPPHPAWWTSSSSKMPSKQHCCSKTKITPYHPAGKQGCILFLVLRWGFG